MKSVIKIFFIGLVILGLVASYINFDTGTVGQGPESANLAESFEGPTDAPSSSGPGDSLPTYIE